MDLRGGIFLKIVWVTHCSQFQLHLFGELVTAEKLSLSMWKGQTPVGCECATHRTGELPGSDQQESCAHGVSCVVSSQMAPTLTPWSFAFLLHPIYREEDGMLRATFTWICKLKATLHSQSSKVVVLMLPCFNLILISFILFYNKWMFLHKYKPDFFYFCLWEVHVVNLLQSLYFVSVVSSNV